jgi:DNA polymerase-3 subunit alpha
MFGGMIAALKEINSKRGERMAFATLEDRRGKVELVIFSNLYREVRDYLRADEPLFISGHMSKDENIAKVIAEKIYFLSEAKQKLKGLRTRRKSPLKTKNKEVKIILNKDEISSECLLPLKNTLTQYRGKCSVYLEIKPQEITIALPYYLRVNPSQDFIRGVNKLLGYEAVEIREYEANSSR